MFVTPKSFVSSQYAPVEVRNQDYEKGFWESAEDAFDYSRYTDLSVSRQNNLHDEYQEVVDTVKRKTGVQLKNPVRDGYEETAWDFAKATASLGGGSRNLLGIFHPKTKENEQNKGIEEFYAQVSDLQQEYPDLVVPTFQDIQERIKNNARQKMSAMYDGRAASGWGEFLGTTAALMTDPVNITATVMTAGIGETATLTLSAAAGASARAGAAAFARGLARTALYEGVSNAASEALIQPSVYQYKQELGFDYAAGDAVKNIAAAGLGGAAFGVAFKTAGSVSARMLSRFRRAKAAGLKFSPRVEAAAEVLDEKLKLDARLEESNPFADTFDGRALHEQKFKAEYYRLLKNEQDAVGRAYDEVKRRPVGDKNDPLVVLKPEDMEEVHIERGEYRPKTRSGYGLLKIEWKHGENSTDAIPVMRDDIVRFPRIIREYEPIDAPEYGSHRTWSVLRRDGAQVIYADAKFAEDQTRHLVSIYVVDPRTKKGSELAGVLSKKRSPQSRAGDFRSSDPDTAGRTFGRPARSESVSNIISPAKEKVNISTDKMPSGSQNVMPDHAEPAAPEPKEATGRLQADDNMVADELNRRLLTEDVEIPVREVDGRVETRSAREMLAEADNYGNYVEEIKSCITEFFK